MSTLFLIRMLMLAVILRFAGRRWRIPYLEAAVCIVTGVLLLQSTRITSLWHGWYVYAVAVCGLVIIGGGAIHLWRQSAGRAMKSI